MEAVIFAVPWLAARLNVQRFHKRIEDLENGSTYRALASDGASVHGLASSFIVCDELAQWKKRELFDVLRTSMGKRRSEEHTSELQSLMRPSYAAFCLNKKKHHEAKKTT